MTLTFEQAPSPRAHEAPPRRLLMIAYAYPPILASGSNRSIAFSRNLAAFGWQPTVLTVSTSRAGLHGGEAIPEGIRIERSREFNLQGCVDILHAVTRRLVRPFGMQPRRNWFRELLCIPDPQIAWSCLPAGLRLARSHDAVYVSCSPFSSALAGVAIKRMIGIPLVVDFRDAWSLNPHADHSRPHRAAITRLERHVLTHCDRLIVNTAGAEALYRRQYPEFASKLVVIPNGYDALNPAPPAARGRRFTIMHVGNFYGSRVPGPLLDALDQIADHDLEFVHVGMPDPALTDRARVRVIPPLKHEEALAMMRTASMLYLKQGFETGVTDYIAVAAKTYEYLATGLPVLADCPEGDNAELVRRYCAYPYVVTSGLASDIRDAVLRAIAAREDTRPHINEAFALRFDRRRLTRDLATVLNEVAPQRRHVL